MVRERSSHPHGWTSGAQRDRHSPFFPARKVVEDDRDYASPTPNECLSPGSLIVSPLLYLCRLVLLAFMMPPGISSPCRRPFHRQVRTLCRGRGSSCLRRRPTYGLAGDAQRRLWASHVLPQPVYSFHPIHHALGLRLPDRLPLVGESRVPIAPSCKIG